ncbi:hypothetical protein [Kitasatospora sp. NPDC086791]|uniref:hypothetical protein n=1 Tax=Kitasatospora sp. NPDC086791 TaxID=3155178 RepID=UPI003413C567
MNTGEWPVWAQRSLSGPRLQTYATAAGGQSAAIRLYWWNIEVSAAFYGPLHCLEVALRNALHDALKRKFGRPDWWSIAPLDADGARLVTDAQAKCGRRISHRPTTADDVVAELSFGFWVKLLSKRYDRTFWVPALHRAFPHGSGRRDALHRQFTTMMLLRNRISHHEPIHHRRLEADHATLFRLLGLLDADLSAEAMRLDRVPTVLKRRQDTCTGLRPPQF